MRSFSRTLIAAGIALGALPAAAATISAPNIGVPYGTSAAIPISVTGVSPDTVVAVEVTLSFDSSIATFDTVDASGHLAAAWLVEYILVDGGVVDTLKIAAATADDTIFVDGTLFDIDFTVIDTRSPASSPLDIEFALLNAGNPVATAANGTLTLVGATGTIASTPPTVLPGMTITVSVTDVDEDRTGAPDSFPVRVVNGADAETLTATETAATSGVFEADIDVVFSAGETAGDGVVQAEAGDLISFCYDDSLDASGATVERCDATSVSNGLDGIVDATIVVEPGDTLYLRVIDPDLNINAGARDAVNLTVTNPATGESESILLTETGADTDTLFGRSYTVFGTVAGAPGDSLVQIQKGDTLTAVYFDEMTVSGPSANRSDSTFVVDPFGDATGDGSVGAFDAARILEHCLKLITLTGLDSLTSNVDAAAPFSEITAFDASLVQQLRVGLLSRFPVASDSSANHPQPETGAAAPKRAARSRAVVLRDRGDHYAVELEEREEIFSGDLMVSGFTGAVESAPEAGLLVAARRGSDGTRIVLATPLPAAGGGALLRLYPKSGEEPRLQSAAFNDGEIRGVVENVDAGTQPPVFELLPNTPNPFNPETTIRYRLPAVSSVRVDIFSEIGQRVRTLVAERQAAGFHERVWAGRDDGGNPVAGGVYFYRMTAGQHRAIGKMVLLK